MKQTTTSLSLPKPIAAYFTADRGHREAVSQCFTENAIVKDEGHTHKGQAAIKEWKTAASAKYQYTSEPFVCEAKDGKIVVTSHQTGKRHIERSYKAPALGLALSFSISTATLE